MNLINLDWNSLDTVALVAIFLVLLALIFTMELVSPKKKKKRRSTRAVSERVGEVID